MITEFGAGISAGARPLGIAAGPDGNLWFTEVFGDRIGRITPTGVITEFGAGITPNSRPRYIAAGPDGNLWFTEFAGNRIGRITPESADPPSPPSVVAAAPPAVPPATRTIARPRRLRARRLIAVRHAWGRQRSGRVTVVDVLALRSIPRGARVQVRCRGRGCPFGRRTLRAAPRVDLEPPFRGRRLGTRTRIEVRARTRGGSLHVVVFTTRARRDPSVSHACAVPGATRVVRC